MEHIKNIHSTCQQKTLHSVAFCVAVSTAGWMAYQPKLAGVAQPSLAKASGAKLHSREGACQGVAARTDYEPGFALARYAVAVSAAAQRRLVGGDGFEPPTLSV